MGIYRHSSVAEFQAARTRLMASLHDRPAGGARCMSYARPTSENRTMDEIQTALDAWRVSLPTEVDAAALYMRSPKAHDWKATLRSLTLREAVFWRLHDLLSQSYALHQQGHALGARILLRSGFETLAMLVYLNWLTAKVLDGSLTFRQYSEKTGTLLLGSRNGSTSHQALNIVTILEKCDARYPGISKLYGELSESAHPNFDGAAFGYSTVDTAKYVSTFSNKWAARYSASHPQSIKVCMALFEAEYNRTWPENFERLEQWIEEHDDAIRAGDPIA
jgi:hypothetical protein